MAVMGGDDVDAAKDIGAKKKMARSAIRSAPLATAWLGPGTYDSRVFRRREPSTRINDMNTSLVLRQSVVSMMFFVMSLLFAAAAHAQKAPADAIIGAWEADDGTIKLEMVKVGSEFEARLLYGNQVVESDNVTFKLDTKNPNPALRSRSLKNIVFLSGLHWEDDEWTGGSLYDGSSGHTYRCKATLQDGKMHLRGYIGIPALSQTKVFHRVNG